MAESIKQQEQQRMDRVVAQIKKAQKGAKNIATAKSDTQAIQDDFKNNLRIKTGTYSGMMETALTVRQQQQQLAERENNKTQAAKRLDVLEKMEQSRILPGSTSKNKVNKSKKSFISGWLHFLMKRSLFSL